MNLEDKITGRVCVLLPALLTIYNPKNFSI